MGEEFDCIYCRHIANTLDSVGQTKCKHEECLEKFFKLMDYGIIPRGVEFKCYSHKKIKELWKSISDHDERR